MAKTAPIPGTSDLFADELNEWQWLEHQATTLFRRYGYGELRTPIFERTEVFTRSIGDETDVVQKEMYTFEDRGGRSLTLRPEGTAGVIRALSNAGIPSGEERRVFYIGPMFRGERPAAGRRRQFHQIGVECVGKSAPGMDVECIAMLMAYLDTIGITGCRLLLNSRGAPADKAPVAQALRTFFGDQLNCLCDDCQRRHETNVLRILDCKNATCRQVIDNAPPMLTLLTAESQDFFGQVCDALDALSISYQVEPRLVRGLDYYAHTVFEVICDGIGAQDALAGGGRYEIPTGSTTLHGVGFAAGIERLLIARAQLAVSAPPAPKVDAYLISLGQDAMNENMRLAEQLRRDGHVILLDLEGRAMRAQMRSANKAGARFAIIRGADELARDIIICKNMESGEQNEFPAATFTLPH